LHKFFEYLCDITYQLVPLLEQLVPQRLLLEQKLLLALPLQEQVLVLERVQELACHKQQVLRPTEKRSGRNVSYLYPL